MTYYVLSGTLNSAHLFTNNNNNNNNNNRVYKARACRGALVVLADSSIRVG